MEKKKSPTQLGFASTVAVYRDDLEEILSILTESCKQVIIEDNEYRFSSLDELMEKRGPNPRQLSINTREPFVIFNVRIKPHYTTLGTSGDGDNLAPYHYVKQILESKKRKGLEFMFSGFPSLVLVVGIMIAWVVLNKKYPGTGFGFWLRFSLGCLIMISTTVAQVYYNYGAFSLISLKRKHELETFWNRNKDKIWLLIIGTLIGLLVGNIPRLFH
jgi:hypothetical protein